MTEPEPLVFDALVQRASALARVGGRAILGVCGAPGSGKTTLAEALVRSLETREILGPGAVAYIPMDGFHLADVELLRLGLLERKGAAETFDAAGYGALLERLAAGGTETVYAPAFERGLEQPIAGAIAAGPSVRLVVTEGNYLLSDGPAWSAAHARMDEVWFCEADDRTRRARLVARHVAFGKTPDDARRWVAEVDEPNARDVAETASRADLQVPPGVVDEAYARVATE